MIYRPRTGGEPHSECVLPSLNLSQNVGDTISFSSRPSCWYLTLCTFLLLPRLTWWLTRKYGRRIETKFMITVEKAELRRTSSIMIHPWSALSLTPRKHLTLNKSSSTRLQLRYAMFCWFLCSLVHFQSQSNYNRSDAHRSVVHRRYSEFQALRKVLVENGAHALPLSRTRWIPGYVSRWEELNNWAFHLRSLQFNQVQ